MVKDCPRVPTEAQVFTCDAYRHDGKLQDVGDNVGDVAPKLGCSV